MEEIVAGSTGPVSTGEMEAILERYLPRIHEANTKAAELRKRILDGDTKTRRARGMIEQHVPTDWTLADVQDAEARLEALRLALREEEAWQCAGMGMALAQGVASVLARVSTQDGWTPPSRSMLRIVMPGLVNLAVELKP